MHRLIYRPLLPAESQSVAICQQREHQGSLCVQGLGRGEFLFTRLPFISTKPAPRRQNLMWRKHPAPQLESP